MRTLIAVIGAVFLSIAAACSSIPEAGRARSGDLVALRGSDPLPANESVLVEIGAHCGVEFVFANGVSWRTDEPGADAHDWMPEEWYGTSSSRGRGLATVSVTLAGDAVSLIATRNNRAVLYRPVTAQDPVDVCY